MDLREKLIKIIEDSGMLDNRNRCGIVADELIANGVTVRDDLTEIEKAMERMGRFGKLFMDYKGCPRGRVGRACGISIYEEATMFGTIVDVEGDRWVPVLEEVLNVIIGMAKGVTVQEWIPVTERLPDLIPCSAGTGYSEAVNVLTSGRKVMVAIWDGIDWLCDMDYWDAWGEEITHWTPVLLPLPEPPKGD